MTPMFREMYSRSRGTVEAILAEGVESGEFNRELDPQVAASLILAILDGVEVQSILGMGITLDSEFLAALRRTILAALSAGAGAGESGNHT